MDKHPGQEHVVATGGEDGMLTVWDLRKEKFPMTLLEAHTGASKSVSVVVVVFLVYRTLY